MIEFGTLAKLKEKTFVNQMVDLTYGLLTRINSKVLIG